MSNPTVNNTCNTISWADSSGYIDSIGVTVGGGPYNLFGICYNNLVCSNKPPNDGGYGNILIGTQTFAFSQPITNPVLAIFSLGNSFGTSPQGTCSTTPLLICNDVTGDACSASTTSGPIAIFGNTITGSEGFGIVMFPGTHNSISIIWDMAENTRIRWGVCSSAVPPPPPPPPPPSPPQSTPPPRIPGSINIKCCKVIPSSTPTTTPTLTPTNTATTTLTPTITPTSSITPTNTPTSTVTPTNTPTTTVTTTITPTISVTATSTPTVTATNTITPTITQTITPTNSITPTQTVTQTQTSANTVTPTKSITPTPTQTVTITTTPTTTLTPTITPTTTVTTTITPTSTVTPTITPSPPLLIKPTDYLILLIDESNSWQSYPNSTAYVNWPDLNNAVRMNWAGYTRYGTGTVWTDGDASNGTNLDYSTTLWESHHNDLMSISSTLDFNKVIVFHTPCRRVATQSTFKCVAEPIFPSRPRSGQATYPKCPIPPKNFKWANRPNRLCNTIVPDGVLLDANYIYNYVINPASTLLDSSPPPGSTIRIFIDNSGSATQDPGGASFTSVVDTFILNNQATYTIVKYTCENEQWLRWIYNAALGSNAICT